MRYLFLLLLLLIADIQLTALYINKMRYAEKTKDDKQFTNARGYFIAASCSVILTLACVIFMAARQFDLVLSVFSEV